MVIEIGANLMNVLEIASVSICTVVAFIYLLRCMFGR